VKFLNITIENFLAIGEAKVKLADRGLCLIQGDNQDDTSAVSNGAGKSSLADALCWCAYGETGRGVSGDAVINDVAGKGTRVALDIEDGTDIYRIIRHRKHKTGKNGLQVLQLFKDGTIADLTLGTDKLTQEVVNRIIGSSLDVFYASIYAAQERMPDLPGMTDKQLKVLVEEAAGVTVLEEAYREAMKRAGLVKDEVVSVDRQIEMATARLEDARKAVETSEAGADTFETRRREQIRDLVDQAKQFQGRARDVQTDLDGKTPKLTLLNGIKDCDDKIAAVSGEQKKLSLLDRSVSNAEGEVKAGERQILTVTNAARNAKADLEAVEHRIGCPCTECSRPITEAEIASARAAAKKRLDVLLVELRDLKTAMEHARKTLTRVTDERDTFALSMTDLSAINAQRASLGAELRIVDGLLKQKEDFMTAASRAADQAREKKGELNPFLAQRAKALERVGELEKGLKEIEQKRLEVDERLRNAETVAKIFSPAAVRAHILDEVTPFLNDQTAKYLSTLSDGNIAATWTTLVKTAKGELREKFAIEVEKDKAGKTFAAISGGEKRKVRIAAALALQDLVARRATKPIELFIGDEIDDALDSAGLERLCVVLEEKARERGSVFVISHNELRDWISQTVVFTMKDGKSTAKEEMA
jgi:DNA repair exonuclease SbcCD ATPase subunit